MQGLLQAQFGLLFRLVARVSLPVLQQGMVADLTGKIRDRLFFFRLVPGGAGLACGFRGGIIRFSFTGRGGRRGVLPLFPVMFLSAGTLFPGPAPGGLLLRTAVQGCVLQGGKAAIDLVHAEPRIFGMLQMSLRQPETGAEQQGIHHHVAGFVPEPGIAPVAPDMVGAGKMHDLVGLGPHQPLVGQGGRPDRVEAQRAAVGPEVAAGAVRFQLQMQGQGAEKGLPEHQFRPGPDHGREGSLLQGGGRNVRRKAVAHTLWCGRAFRPGSLPCCPGRFRGRRAYRGVWFGAGVFGRRDGIPAADGGGDTHAPGEGGSVQGRKIVPVHIRTSALSRAQRAKGSLSTTAGS